MKGLRNTNFDKDLSIKFCIYKEKSKMNNLLHENFQFVLKS